MNADYYVHIYSDNWDLIDQVGINAADIHAAEAKAEDIADTSFDGPVNLVLCDRRGELLWSWTHNLRLWV